MLTDYEISSEFQENYVYARDYWAPYIKDAQVYTLASSGYTWSNEERRALIQEGREPIEFNITRRPLEFFSGYLRDNINQIVYSPVEGSDERTADQFTKLSYYIWDKGNGYPVYLDACDEGFKSGIALAGIQMDYSRDFINGDISFYKRTYNSFYLDPTFESINLKDCAFAITRDLVSKQYVKALCPFIDPKDIDDLMTGFRDDKFIQYHPQFMTFSRNKNLLAYDQYYRMTTRDREMLIDLSTGHFRDITDLEKEEKDKLKMGIRRFDQMRELGEEGQINPEEIPNVEIRQIERTFVELNIMLNGVRLYCGEDKTGIVETYPFVPILCYFEPSIWMPSQRIQGIAACNYSMQRQFNKRHMKIIDMMDSTISTGFKYLLGSVPNPLEMQQSGQNKIIGVDPENAPQGLDSIQELNGGGANPALMEYQRELNQLSLTLSNVTESVMGIDEKGNTQISGRLAQVRIAQGLRGNRKIFDNVEVSQQVLGGLILTCIQKNYPPEKVQRILNEEPTEQFYEQQYEQYDAVIKEGVRSKSQKDAYYYELVNLKKEGIVDVPQKAIVDALSMAGITDLEEAIEAQDKSRAEQQAKIDELEQVKLKLGNSQVISNLALAKEREARIIADIGLAEERHSEAASNMADAVLARAKAIVEISSMQEDRIAKVLQFVNELQLKEEMMQQVISDQTEVKAQSIKNEDDMKMQQQGLIDGMEREMNEDKNMQTLNEGG